MFKFFRLWMMCVLIRLRICTSKLKAVVRHLFYVCLASRAHHNKNHMWQRHCFCLYFFLQHIYGVPPELNVSSECVCVRIKNHSICGIHWLESINQKRNFEWNSIDPALHIKSDLMRIMRFDKKNHTLNRTISVME